MLRMAQEQTYVPLLLLRVISHWEQRLFDGVGIRDSACRENAAASQANAATALHNILAFNVEALSHQENEARLLIMRVLRLQNAVEILQSMVSSKRGTGGLSLPLCCVLYGCVRSILCVPLTLDPPCLLFCVASARQVAASTQLRGHQARPPVRLCTRR